MLKDFEWKPRTRAAGIHLGISALVALAAAGLVFGLWFPAPYSFLSGGRQLFLLLVSVDVVLGPLLTWLVFDRRKPRAELVRDLGVVGLLQCAALGYGMWSMYQARPVYLVHEVDRFVVVSAADVDPADLALAAPAFERLPFSGTALIGLRDHRDAAERARSFELALAGKDLSIRPEYWQALSESNLRAIQKHSRPLQQLMDRSSSDRVVVEKWLSEHGMSARQVRFLPMVSRQQFWSVLLEADSLSVIGFLPLDGF